VKAPKQIVRFLLAHLDHQQAMHRFPTPEIRHSGQPLEEKLSTKLVLQGFHHAEV
jgi:hypothetical protein